MLLLFFLFTFDSFLIRISSSVILIITPNPVNLVEPSSFSHSPWASIRSASPACSCYLPRQGRHASASCVLYLSLSSGFFVDMLQHTTCSADQVYQLEFVRPQRWEMKIYFHRTGYAKLFEKWRLALNG